MQNPLSHGSLIASLFVAVACGSAPANSFFDEPTDGPLNEDNESKGGGPATGGTLNKGSGGSSGGSAGKPQNSSTGGTGSNNAGSGNMSSGGSSAGSSSGGEAGSGEPPIILDLIDDMEDKEPSIPERSGRRGFWNKFSDETGTHEFEFAPTTPARSNSNNAVRVSGVGFQKWGAGVGFNLKDDPVLGLLPYDASAYRGISFWARASIDNLEILIQMPDNSSHPKGLICGAECNNHFLAKRDISKQWVQYTVNFAELAREHKLGPNVTMVAKDKIYSIEFIVRPPTNEFEFWLDDIVFIKAQ